MNILTNTMSTLMSNNGFLYTDADVLIASVLVILVVTAGYVLYNTLTR